MSRPLHYRQQLDLLTDEILNKSSAVIKKIDETMKHTHALRSSNFLTCQIDLHMGNLTSDLQQYQSILSQLNTLLIRSEYFEAQLRLLESQICENQSWRENDLKWRATEATLENLFLEFRFLSEKLTSLSGPTFGFKSPFQSSETSSSRRVVSSAVPNLNTNHVLELSPLNSRLGTFDHNSMRAYREMDQRSQISLRSFSKRSPTLSKHSFKYLPEKETREEENEVYEGILLPKKRTDQSKFTLKPIRCTSNPVVKPGTKRKSMEIRSLNLLAMKVSSSLPPTPNSTSVENSTFSISSPFANSTSLTPFQTSPIPEDPLFVNHLPSHLTSSPQISTKSHSRCSSLPQSLCHHQDDSPKKTNLRHFISHDTGLKVKTHLPHQSPGEQYIKESQFVESPVDTTLESTLDQKGTDVVSTYSKTEHEDDTVTLKSNAFKTVVATIAEEAEENDDQNESVQLSSKIPTFEHKLNRSSSCDSIFSIAQTRIHVPPKRNNKEQTMNWMRNFSSKASIARETDVSAFSASSSTINSSTKALHSLVSQASKEEYVSLSRLLPPTTLSWSSFWTKKSDTRIPSGACSNLLPETVTRSEADIDNITIPTESVSALPSVEEKSDLQQLRQPWTLLLSKFTTESVLNPPNVVTSEVGKPIKPIPINGGSNTSVSISRLNYPHRSEKLKGAASTITIGPNGSKFVNHGESSSLAQSLVVSSRISHNALKEALAEDFLEQSR